MLTDDSAAENKAINTVFTSSRVLLCSWHLIEAVKRWVSQHIPDRTVHDSCVEFVRELLYSASAADFESRCVKSNKEYKSHHYSCADNSCTIAMNDIQHFKSH